MGLLDALKGGADGKTFYRREWQETNNPVVREARAQTLAIQRLEVWLRLVYSVLALAVLLGYWGFASGGGVVVGVLGAVIGVIAFACAMVLRTGISHGRANVNAMLRTLEQQRDASADEQGQE